MLINEKLIFGYSSFIFYKVYVFMQALVLKMFLKYFNKKLNSIRKQKIADLKSFIKQGKGKKRN